MQAFTTLRAIAAPYFEADIDTDKLTADLYRARDEGSRPITRP